jgi:hypothetical protein
LLLKTLQPLVGDEAVILEINRGAFVQIAAVAVIIAHIRVDIQPP